MEKLQLKHLVPYFLYGVKLLFDNGTHKPYIVELDVLHKLSPVLMYSKHKLILKPMSDLVNYYDEICWGLFDSRNPNNYESAKFMVDEVICNGVTFDTYFGLVEWLFKNHFDVFDLIKKGLAVDYKSLPTF